MNAELIKLLLSNGDAQVEFVSKEKGFKDVEILVYRCKKTYLTFEVKLHQIPKPFVKAVILNLGYHKIDDSIIDDVNNRLSPYNIKSVFNMN